MRDARQSDVIPLYKLTDTYLPSHKKEYSNGEIFNRRKNTFKLFENFRWRNFLKKNNHSEIFQQYFTSSTKLSD